MPESHAKPIVLYDGVCGLCNRLVQFLLRHDNRDRLRFAPLQSHLASSLLRKHNLEASDLDSVYVVTHVGDQREQVLGRSEAILQLGFELGGIWRAAAIVRVLPRVVRDWIYNLVAKNRYRLFGRYDSCPVPDERDKGKFLEL